MRYVCKLGQNKAQLTGLIILLLFVCAALFGPTLTKFEPFAVDGERFAPPSSVHWLGTNALGQDIFSIMVHGARTTLWIGLSVATLSTALSALLGLAAGYSKRLDPLLNGLANMLLVLPSLLLILIVASFSGGGIWQLILTLGLLTWPGYMRLIRASVLSLREREFVKAAELYGGHTPYILRKHLLPFLWPLLRTKFIMSFQMAVGMEAGLAFLGIGDPRVPSWGKLLEQAFARSETWMSHIWQWTLLPPVLAILLVTVALALLSDQTGSVSGSSRLLSPLRLFSRKPRFLTKKSSPVETADRHNQKPGEISIESLTVRYRELPVLEQLSLTVTPGSIIAIVGESGSGKTTLARALYGLLPEHAVEGTIRLAGRNVYPARHPNRLRRWQDAAFIFQDPRSSFNPLLTIGQQFIETMDPSADHDKWEQAAAALAEVRLNREVLHCFPHQLSGGMLSRALIALALINKPTVLIADEPTGALDPIVKREILELLVSKVRMQRMTLLLITHDLPAARHYADRVVTIDKGRLDEASAPDEQEVIPDAPQPIA
ncbi:ATP-binding cassette domain-containing protein [Paenibacillus senegalensis]|uniref:ATP-binding cassette domain-containing protein n=1 Tax=Paenibacillus senegalensis TaxID=1465766 RepID=UPI000288BD9C|nr:ATP-binding cassette domain-containing protein [Paenibacillus senegalensis]